MAAITVRVAGREGRGAWRTRARHHQAQAAGRSAILGEYHLRVGQLTRNTRLAPGHELREQRLDETEVGAATTVVLVDAAGSAEWMVGAGPQEIARWLGLPAQAAGLVAWDVFEAVLTPGHFVLVLSWRDEGAAAAFDEAGAAQGGGRVRRVRVVRDYGMFDRREAPQYYPDAAGQDTVHA